jgi:hypothetical protein
MVEHVTDTDKLKEFLGRKLTESQAKIKKLKRKRKINKSLYIMTTVSSMVISSVLASISMLTIPPLALTILAISSAILTGISARFNFQDKTVELSKEIEKLDKIQSKLDYVISCNGNLLSEAYQKIISEFST